MGRFLHDNGLSVTLLVLFLVSLAEQAMTGWRASLHYVDRTELTQSKVHSNSKTEELVYNTDFAYRSWLLPGAVTAADHAHDFEALQGRRGGSHRLETARRPDHALERTMVCLNDVVQILRCSTFFDSRPSFCRRRIALG